MIMIDDKTRVAVQGITGHQGRFHTKAMIDAGTNIVCGVTPGKNGQEVEGVQVYDSLTEAEGEPNAAIIFVPARYAKAAMMEAIDAGMNPIVPITEHIPVRDSMECIARAKAKGIRIVGPNTPGLMSCGLCKMGIMPSHIFTPGRVGIASRSGTLTYEVVSQLSSRGIGQSTVVGLGGDPVTGLDFVAALELFAKDDSTDAIILLGEIGGSKEERAAQYIMEGYDKPVIAYVAGRCAPRGKTMGHAGAIVTGDKGTYESKEKAFQDASVSFAQLPKDIAGLAESVV